MTIFERAVRKIAEATGSTRGAEALAEEMQDAGLLAFEYETVEEANAEGVYVGTLANGDTFGDPDAVYVPKRTRKR